MELPLPALRERAGVRVHDWIFHTNKVDPELKTAPHPRPLFPRAGRGEEERPPLPPREWGE